MPSPDIRNNTIGVTAIGPGAFNGCSNLVSVVLPSGVTAIEDAIFANCTSLSSVTIPVGVTSIGDYAFAFCDNLKSITIPSGVAAIGARAFYGSSYTGNYSGMRSIVLPESVTSIGEYALGYYIDETVMEIKAVEGYLVYGYIGSAAERYAQENGFTFVALDLKETSETSHTHTWGNWTVTAAATVFEAEQQTRTCSTCHKTETRSYGYKLTPTISLNASSLKLKKKQSTSAFKVSGMANGDSVKSVTSGNKKVLKVVSYKADGTIKLKALKKTGTAKLTITLASGTKKTVTVKVQSGTVKTTKLTVVSKKLTLKKGSKATLEPTVTPITSQQKVIYASSNKKVATVTSKGVVKAKKAGTAKITVKSGSKKVIVTVKVTK